MPSGKTHTKINSFLWIIYLLIFLKYYYIFTPYLKTGIWYQYFSGWYLTGTWFALFSLDYYIHTIYLTPDVDTKSDARRKLGFIGKIIDWIFPHRGPTHSIILLSVIFGLLGYFIGTWFIGGWLACMSHIVVDHISTGVKKIVPDWIERGVKKVLKTARKVI